MPRIFGKKTKQELVVTKTARRGQGRIQGTLSECHKTSIYMNRKEKREEGCLQKTWRSTEERIKMIRDLYGE